MDCDSYQSIQHNYTKSPKRSILTDHTNINLLDNTRKRSHTSSTGKPLSSKKELPENKRPKQDPLPATPPAPVYNYTRIFSLFRNPLSIFYQWNPVKDKTHTKPPDTLTTSAPKPKLQQPMQGLPDPLLGVNPSSTIGPTIKPWAYLSVKRDRDDLSSILTVNQRSSVSRNIFQTQAQTPSNKTIFKNDLFTRQQNESYKQLLDSESIPRDILTSTPKPVNPPLSSTSSIHDITQDTFEIPNSARLSSTLIDPLRIFNLNPVSYRHSRDCTPVPLPQFKPPPSRNTSLYRPPKYDVLSFKPISLHTHTPTQSIHLPTHTPRYNPTSLPEQDDIHIVSVDNPTTTPSCILTTASDKYIGIIRRDFDLNKIKKEFEEEELNAYNHKLFLSELERKQPPATHNRPVRTRGKTSIDELKERMDRLVYTLESDIEDSRMPLPYKPVDLGDEMELRVSNALVNTPIEEVLSSGYRIHIKRKDMSTLQLSQWLNDEVINFYCSMIADRSTQHTKSKPVPTVHTFNTFFYTQLKDRGYDSIKRWTRKVDIFTLDIITIPIHLGMHWCMAIIDFRGKTVVYYDSFLGSNSRCLDLLFEYLHKERRDKKGEEFDSTDWKCFHEKEIPEQKNSSDCGVFACQFAEFITRDAAISFTQEDMPHLRRQMVAEVLNKKLYH